MPETTLIFSDLRFPEGARWHGDRLWFSDMHTGQVFRANPLLRTLEEYAIIDDQPSGLGWLPDGDLLVSSMLSRAVLRVAATGEVSRFAELSSLTAAPVNDLVTTPSGTTYLGGFGYDLYADAPAKPGPILRIDPDSSTRIVETDMTFPNGMVILPGTSTLVVAETWAARLTAFDIDDDGGLSGKRVWAELPPDSTPDGICVDAAGAVWVSSIATSQFLRVEAGGRISDVISVDGRCATDCVLGGPNGTTLFLLTSNSWQPSDTTTRQGRIEAVEVAVPAPEAGA
ncbi:SMP-30/gluconolactonase/LRE family protein [Aeromicrobium sp. YIM 150415]|uniref:SMP-30/gluconolactonase/LRE family protein n=1 Tax=Aeromicrobium sp. YIM 150415 TaxID=2803912 RepID=UPI0019625D97|nr:SMP-30/gluconolactonase/LRE family protein [Aeromicrobium sp. YIM 150415]MBM9463989.1 SMP-30/gluconolactonase/LRE family protein [Aeromicrobium sp. YIM 150415]